MTLQGTPWVLVGRHLVQQREYFDGELRGTFVGPNGHVPDMTRSTVECPYCHEHLAQLVCGTGCVRVVTVDVDTPDKASGLGDRIDGRDHYLLACRACKQAFTMPVDRQD